MLTSSSTGSLTWAQTFAGQTTLTVAQVSAVAVDGSGNIEVTGN